MRILPTTVLMTTVLLSAACGRESGEPADVPQRDKPLVCTTTVVDINTVAPRCDAVVERNPASKPPSEIVPETVTSTDLGTPSGNASQ